MNVIELSLRSQKFLDKLDLHIRKRIEERLKNLKTNPIPSDSKFIGRDGGAMIFRYRIGNYRSLYKYFTKEKIVLIMKIDKRSRVYERDLL